MINIRINGKPLLDTGTAIFSLILIALIIAWVLYYNKAHQFKILNSKENYRKVKSHVKSEKNYKLIATLINIIIILALIYLAYVVLSTILISILIVGTFGVIFLADSHTLGRDMLDAQKFNASIFPYALYIFSCAIIIKNIFFNAQLYKFLCTNKNKFCTNCGSKINGNFCGNCGNKIN